MKSWVKGGLWGLAVGVIVLFFLSYYLLGTISFLCIKNANNKIVLWYTDNPGDPLYNAPHCNNNEVLQAFLKPELLVAFIDLSFFFLVGAGIGWIAGKIKARKK